VCVCVCVCVCLFVWSRMRMSHIGHSPAGSDVSSQVATNVFFFWHVPRYIQCTSPVSITTVTTVMMEVALSAERPVEMYQFTRNNNPQISKLQHFDLLWWHFLWDQLLSVASHIPRCMTACYEHTSAATTRWGCSWTSGILFSWGRGLNCLLRNSPDCIIEGGSCNAWELQQDVRTSFSAVGKRNFGGPYY
jgi:hypothetical protein